MCKRFRVILNILIVLHIQITSADSQFDVLKTPRAFEKQSRGIMSPKMDYDEWTPLGRGDPLKNDPTFDYSPPMLSKVKYWISPLLRTPDPPIIPIKDLTTETSQITATITSSKTPNLKSSEIKRFYIDFKDPSDMSYVQLMNNKYNNKFVRPQQMQYQNHYYSPTRQPPPPLPMLVPPPPVEPNSYSKNISTTLALPWNSNKTQLPSIATTISYASYATTNQPPVTKSSFATPKSEAVTKTEIPFLKRLLDKETSESYHVTNPTTLKPLTPNPMPYKYSHSAKAPSYLIIQGHSKVKNYGIGKIDRSDNVVLQDTNDIGESVKYELPKEMRGSRQLGVEEFLPFDGILGETLKDFVSSQAEGSGIGAELTRVMFPSYIRPTPTLEYESPRIQEDEEEEES